jgi:hypothetical protein
MAESVKRSGRPPRVEPPTPPALWESESVARKLDKILNALEVPTINTETRRTLQRLLYR